MDVDSGPESTMTKAMQEDPALLQPNALISDMQSLNPDPESDSLTSREQLDMLTSNGLLDGALDANVMRILERSSEGDLDRSTGILSNEMKEDAVMQGTSDAVEEEFSGNGLLAGGMLDDAPQNGSDDGETESATLLVPVATQDSLRNPEDASANPPSIADAFHANGLLSSMEEGPTDVTDKQNIAAPPPAPETSTADVSGFQANGLLGSFDDPPADRPATAPIDTAPDNTPSAPALDNASPNRDTSSLDQLLDEMDSAGNTTLSKGKARAVPLPAITRKHPMLPPDRRSATPMASESATASPVESGYPHVDVVSMTEEARGLVPLEAVDQNGRKMMFQRRARKVVDGRAVSRSPNKREACRFADELSDFVASTGIDDGYGQGFEALGDVVS